MDTRFNDFTVLENDSVITALSKIDKNTYGFVIVINTKETVLGVLTDGDVRRAIIGGSLDTDTISKIYTKNFKYITITDGIESVSEMFKNPQIKFLPVVDIEKRLVNIITKNQMHALLLQDIHADLSYDFLSIDTTVIDHEILLRPWGYYKTTVLNDYFQGKIISVKPGGKLSLQSHNHREEHWCVVHGKGVVQLDESVLQVSYGSTIFIPKGCKHRITNVDKNENLIITEVQIGDYFGEDDIIRYEDVYGRT